jgi:hypothetical protein
MPRKIPKRRKAYDDPSFNKVALLIGHISMNWSRVEDIVDHLIGRMLGLEERSNIGNAVTSNMDIRNKIQTVKALFFETKTSEAWFEKIASLLDEIDNTLRPERNRYVHGHWFIPDGKLTRVSRRIKFKKAQAFQALSLTTEERSRINLRDAQRFCTKLERAWLDLFIMTMPKNGGPPFPATPDEQSPRQTKP